MSDLMEPFAYSRARKLIHALLPPVLGQFASWFRVPEWEFVADEWPLDDLRSSGWDNPTVVDVMRKNWNAYRQTVGGNGPLALLPWSTNALSFFAHNHIMIYGFVLARVAHEKRKVSVLDWGGALGHYALIGEALLPNISLDYTVQERPALCAAGRQLLPEVSFVSSDEILPRRYDLVMAAGSIQYEKDWRSVTRSLANASEHWVFVSQVPITQSARSFVVVQRPFRVGMHTEYISWVFNREEFLTQMKDVGLNLDREVLCSEHSQHYRKTAASSELRGFLFRRS